MQKNSNVDVKVATLTAGLIKNTIKDEVNDQRLKSSG